MGLPRGIHGAGVGTPDPELQRLGSEVLPALGEALVGPAVSWDIEWMSRTTQFYVAGVGAEPERIWKLQSPCFYSGSLTTPSHSLSS